MKVIFKLDLELKTPKNKVLGNWECRVTNEMRFEERPRIGENWLFYSEDGTNLLEDYSQVKSVYVNWHPKSGPQVDVRLSDITLGASHLELISLLEKLPEWQVLKLNS